MGETLKPCPLCGGAAAIMQYERSEGSCRAIIRCVCCGLTLDYTQYFATAPKRPLAPSDDGERVSVALNLSPFDAWNRRDGGDFTDGERIIKLPCEIGSKFYGVNSSEVCEYTVNAIECRRDKLIFRTIYDMPFIYGEEAFLTKDEAEASIKQKLKE